MRSRRRPFTEGPLMALGRRRRERQGELWVATDRVAAGPRNVFYERLNAILAEAGFDTFVEELCAPFYRGRRPARHPAGDVLPHAAGGLPRGARLAARHRLAMCGDSLSLKAFLGVGPFEATPEHLQPDPHPRPALAPEVFDEVFALVLNLAAVRGLLADEHRGGRRDDAGGERREEVDRPPGHRRRLRAVRADGSWSTRGRPTNEDQPTDEEVRRFDREAEGEDASRTRSGRARPTPTRGS